jgi:lambda family phage portal protein
MGLYDWMRSKLTAVGGKAKRDNYAATYGNGSAGGFAGAAVNRLTASMASWSGSVNLDLDGGGLSILRARARQLAQSNEYGKRFLSQVATNVVGRTGPMLQVRAMQNQRDPNKPTQLDKAANDAIEIHFARWAKKADIAGRMTWAHILRVAIKGVARDGEALVRIVRNRALPYGIAIQLLEPDRLDDQLNMVLPNGAIRQGVEIDGTGRAVALWIKTKHPGDQYGTARSDMERIPMGDVIHLFLQERAEQVRGYSWFHAIILRATQLGGFNDAAVLAARIGASKIAAIQRTDETPDSTISMADSQGPQGAFQMNVEAGEMFELPPGYTLASWNPDYPHANYESFVKAAMRGISAGLDVATHNLSGDMTDVNYSSARIAELGEREVWMLLQDWLIASLVEPIYQEWLASALLRGDITFEISGKALPADKLAKFTNASRFQGRRWRWVDPSKELDAYTKAVELGITSRTRIAAEQGDDLDDVLDELQQEHQAMLDKGLNPTPNQYNQPAAVPVDQTPEVVSAKALATATVRAAELHKDAAIQSARNTPAPVPAAGPQLNVTMDMTAEAMQAAMLKAAAPFFKQFEATAAAVMEREMQVNIQVPEQPAPNVTVNVAAPNVTLEATVPEAQVIVNNTHPTRALQTVERNSADEIVRTTTTYEN